MKEATGELNMTVVTVVAIAAVMAFFYAIIWPAIKTSLEQNTYCSQAVCGAADADGFAECHYIDEDGDEEEITCAVEEN